MALDLYEVPKEKQTYKMCLESVRADENDMLNPQLKKVNEIYRTKELCLEAVRNNGFALRFVKEQTPEICLEAVKKTGMAL